MTNILTLGFPGGTSGKEPDCQCRRLYETQVWSLGGRDPLEKGMTTYSSILAWRFPWTEEPGGLQSLGSQSRSWLKWQHRTARFWTWSSSNSKNLNLIINVLDNLGLTRDQLLQLCPTLCNPMDCSSTGFSAPRILQVRRLEWVAMPSSRGSSWPRYRTHVLANGFFTTSDTWEAQLRIV